MGWLERMGNLLRGGAAPAGPRAREPEAPEETPPPAGLADIIGELQRIVSELSDQQLSPEEVDPRASLLEEAVLDSVAGVQMLTLIEERYGVVIEEVELAGGLKSLDDVARRVIEIRQQAES